MNKLQMVKMGITKVAGRSGLLAKKYSPEILIAAGIIGLVTSTVIACRATASTKMDDITETFTLNKEESKYLLENPKECISLKMPGVYTEKEYRKDVALNYIHTGARIVKLYAPAVTLGTASIICILGAHNIMKKRNVALAAAYKAVEQGFSNYRKRVVEEFGEEKDYQFKNGIRQEQVTVIEEDEDGKKKKVKKTVENVDPNGLSVYAKWFDEGCDNWSKTPEYNLLFIKNQQNYANDMLHSRGHLFLNEVYDMLGIERTQAGQVVGWVMSKDGDNFVDFGIYNKDNIAAHYFVNGTERSILLDFNVDGVIYDLI